ncbi:MAG: hypothetical protein JSR09_05895 [Bacteroidetes bacterium]|nr:hypothetical protein [Bacteroidota bacterium]
MRTLSKIGLTIVAFMIGGLIITALNEAQGTKHGGGPIGVIFTLGMIAAITAIWKWKPENKEKDNTPTNNQQLDKS